MLVDNVETVLTGPLPRRRNGTLLHEAAAAGNLGLVRQALVTLRLVRDAGETVSLEEGDAQGKEVDKHEIERDNEN